MDYWQEKFKKSILLYQKNPNATNLFTLIYAGRAVAQDSHTWEAVEDVIEDVLKEKPDWHEFKKIYNNFGK
jgi:hypothetical protein